MSSGADAKRTAKVMEISLALSQVKPVTPSVPADSAKSNNNNHKRAWTKANQHSCLLCCLRRCLLRIMVAKK